MIPQWPVFRPVEPPSREPAGNWPTDPSSATPSVLRHLWIDFVGPGQDSTFEVEDFAETGFAQKVDGLGGTLATAAMRDDFARRIQFVHAPRQFTQRNQVPVEIANLVFVWFAHIQNEE